jgi:hypothetical protein
MVSVDFLSLGRSLLDIDILHFLNLYLACCSRFAALRMHPGFSFLCLSEQIEKLSQMQLQEQEYKKLIEGIGHLLATGREKAALEVNSILVQTYWEIGRYIVEFEQGGNEKAEYGSQLFDRLSAKDLTQSYGKGFSRSNLLYMRKVLSFFPK